MAPEPQTRKPTAWPQARHAADVVILGAGAAGIAAAIALGEQAIVLEKKSAAGGLGSSIEIRGAVFDIGGHSFHTPHPEVKQLVFNSIEMTEQKREARCYAYGSMIPYPFQRHFQQLQNPAVVQECERGLRHVPSIPKTNHLEQYLKTRFGAGVSKHFLLPYNQRLWQRDLKRLSADWVNQRIAAPEGKNETFHFSGGQRKPLQEDTRISYPARGGYGEILNALARKIADLRTNVDIKQVDPGKREVILANGERYCWKKLISTIPIHQLLKLINSVPQSLLEDASRLEFLSLRLIFAVIGHPVDTEIQRIYTAEKNIPAHKITLNHNSSDFLRAKPHHGIMGEVAYSKGSRTPGKDTEKRFEESLIQLGLIRDSKEVIEIASVDVPHAYPVPTLDRSAIVGRIRVWLEERDIYTIGRFGEWEYINSDEALYRGLWLGHSLMNSNLQAAL